MRCSAKLLRSGAPLVRDRTTSDFRTVPGLRSSTACCNASATRGANVGLTTLFIFGCEQRRLMLGHQRVDDLAQRFAGHDLRQLVEREIDAVVGHAGLRKIVGADPLGAVAGADLAAPLRGALG